ncbi:MAG: hypothetical protein WCS43_18045, partial [Verrucomicrobiota bacterium]
MKPLVFTLSPVFTAVKPQCSDDMPEPVGFIFLDELAPENCPPRHKRGRPRETLHPALADHR